jgi:hypothetical protein
MRFRTILGKKSNTIYIVLSNTPFGAKERLNDIAHSLAGVALPKSESPWIKISKNVKNAYICYVYAATDTLTVMVEPGDFEKLMDSPTDPIIEYVHLSSNSHCYSQAHVDVSNYDDLKDKLPGQVILYTTSSDVGKVLHAKLVPL